jgi:sugar phosphate isomerase/epimerase
MSDRLYVHVPCSLLEQNLELLVKLRLQPEIAFKCEDLEKPSGWLIDCCDRLRNAGLGVTVHGPFMDLNPGALDPLVREATLLRFRQTLDLAARCRARLVVFHPGFDRWRYGGRTDLWLAASLSFWPPLIEEAAARGCVLALENIFDQYPEPLATLIDQLDSPWLGHCFDVGHWNLFAKVSLGEWIDAIGRRLVHLHLHDNDGDSDAHLPAGEGNIDFDALFRQLDALPQKLTATLEIHSRPGLLRSFPAFVSRFRS